jgi:hypothetical protein
MYYIPFIAKRQIELVGSVGPFAKSFYKCPCYMFSASFSARTCRKSACLESAIVLGASLILHAFELAFYYVLDRAIVYKKNICIEMVRIMLFAVFPVLEFIAWIICRSQQRRLLARLTIAWDLKACTESVYSKRPILIQENAVERFRESLRDFTI